MTRRVQGYVRSDGITVKGHRRRERAKMAGAGALGVGVGTLGGLGFHKGVTKLLDRRTNELESKLKRISNPDTERYAAAKEALDGHTRYASKMKNSKLLRRGALGVGALGGILAGKVIYDTMLKDHSKDAKKDKDGNISRYDRSRLVRSAVSSANRTSQEMRGWVNLASRAMRFLGGY